MNKPMMTEDEILQLAARRILYRSALRSAEQKTAEALVKAGKLVRKQPTRKSYYTLPK